MSTKWMKTSLILAFCFVVAPCFAGPPYDVEDPETPELHHFEVNVGYVSSQVRGSETQEFPNFDINYGYFKNLQLTVGISGISTRVSGQGRTAGFGDTSLEAKWRFKEETKTSPQWALHYAISLPTGDASRGLGTGSVDHNLELVGQKSFGRSTLFGNIGANIPGGADGRANLLYGLAYTYQLTEKLSLGAEIYGNSSAAEGERDELAWGLGLTYNFQPDRALLLKFGRSAHGFSDLNTYAGIQFSFK